MENENFIIYKLTNTVNNKIYVGGTTDTIDTRFHRHVVRSLKGSEYPLHKAIREYGEEAFEKVIIEDCSSLEQMNERERYWIATLSATNPEIGYNAKAGGGIRLQSVASRLKIGEAHKGKISEKRTPILQYTKDGLFIAEYPSLTEAAEQVKLQRSQIIRSLQKEYTKPSDSNPYIWIYKSDMQSIPLQVDPSDFYSNLNYKPKVTVECISKSILFNNNLSEIITPVAQYSLDGELIKKYYSIAEAVRCTGVSGATIRKFINNPDYLSTIKRKDKTKYIWKACDKNDPDVVKTEDDMKKIAAKKHCKIIKAYDKDGNLVKEYQGRKEFEKIEHADIRSVKATILADTDWKGLYWEIN